MDRETQREEDMKTQGVIWPCDSGDWSGVSLRPGLPQTASKHQKQKRLEKILPTVVRI